MTLGEPARLSEADSEAVNPMTDPNVPCLENKHAQNALDGSMTALHTPPIEISTPSIPHTHPSTLSIASQGSVSESETPAWTLTPVETAEDSESSKADKGKGKETDRGRTNDRTFRAANPTARAESFPRRLDPSFELISQPTPVRPLPLDKRAGNLSRSDTLHSDPSDKIATLDDEVLEQCPNVSALPLAEVLESAASDTEEPYEDQEADSEQSRSDTPSPVTGIFRSNSNELYELKITKISAANAFDSDQPPLYAAPTLPADIIAQQMPNLSHLEYLVLKSSTKEWSRSSVDDGQGSSTRGRGSRSKSIAPKKSLMALLPTEIIHQVYMNLGLTDFNAVRRVNRKWFIASLDKGILSTMLRRGGWSHYLDREPLNTLNFRDIKRTTINTEWLLSKRVAREAALGPNWTGDGFEPRPSLPQPDIGGLSGLSNNTENAHPTTAFALTAVTDFSDVGIHYPAATPGSCASGSGSTFTVSVCGRFLMVANGCLIYIYELNRPRGADPDDRVEIPGELKPVTSIICPRRVLACSMDTSSHRYAIAVLLDGRMGLVCDITAPGTGSPRVRSDSNSTITAIGSSSAQAGPSGNSQGNYHSSGNYRNSVTINSSTSNAFERAVTETPFVFPVIAAHDSNHPGVPDFQSGAWQDLLQNDIPSTSMKSLQGSRKLSPEIRDDIAIPGFRPFPTATATAMPLEYGPRSIYRNLCSEDDPPRSVAICPQRRCVAFGCSAGIELHWVDALTGQDLNRWFPLTAPSDFLYFLPPRRGIDSAKKLRLISSAASPAESSAIADRFRSSSTPSGSGPTGRLFDLNPHSSGRELNIGSGSLRSDESDHYRAVPLSDGYHILFTNPVTGVLCLGSDAPIGGPTKLLRKMWFVGPKGRDKNRPVSYTGASNLTAGVRIAAAYDNEDGNTQSIWLFSVPGDVFKDSQVEPVSAQTLRRGEQEWRDWWNMPLKDNENQNSHQCIIPSNPGSSMWPIQIRGQEIGNCIGLVDLAIHAGPNITIWAFTRAGTALVWEIDDGNPNRNIKRRIVLRDGTIRELDENGDINMPDADGTDDLSPVVLTPSKAPLQQSLEDTFDGTASLCKSTCPFNNQLTLAFASSSKENQDLEEEAEVTHIKKNVDNDGDVLMNDLTTPEIWVSISEVADDVPGRSSAFEETVERVNRSNDESAGSAALYRSTRWAGRFVEYVGVQGGVEADLVEEVTGIARMDIEIY